ncbi:MAG TPA: OmpA family protein [Acetobacteraceae bacterium]|jgi:outer membrane protein OmpA-like peptidoglycan-associated protein|nr:OmpA family protein [Acetobacteraceae bacterium]
MRIRNLMLLGTIIATPSLAVAQPVTGLYVGAGAGANFLQNEVIKGVQFPNGTTALAGSNPKFDTGAVGVASVGWGFGNGFRAEIEGNFRWNNGRSVGGYGTIASGSQQTYGAMVNGYYDFDLTGYGINFMYPYVGVGIGYAHDQWNGIGALSQGAPVQTGFRINNSTDTFAYQAIAGASFPVASFLPSLGLPGLSLTAEYRFYSIPDDQKFKTQFFAPTGTSGPRTKVGNDLNHSVLIGLRYAFNVPAPPPTPAAPPPAPAPAPARSYLVFFDWDRADLTARARQVISEAAQNYTRVQVTRIEVNGYTDTSGTAAYNQRLSVRRAEAVAAELARDGVPRNVMDLHGYGDTRLLVQTGPGVREPQNRRVEIIYH